MGKTDMNHMVHLESVALSDCAVLQTKEGTYQGSWKRSGGASAWFMFRRNMDRMITMMSPKEFPSHIQTPANVKDTIMVLRDVVQAGGKKSLYGLADLPGSPEASEQILAMLADRFTSEDIFMKIREEPSGKDGTVLACMRDMRRYAMLVEAEMIAEGVVEPESKTYEQETGMYHPPETDVYQLIADEKRLDRQTVKDLIHDLFYSDVGNKCRVMLLDGAAMPTLGPLEIVSPTDQPLSMDYPKATVHVIVKDGVNITYPNALNVQVVFTDKITIRLEKGHIGDSDHSGYEAASPASDGFRTTPVTAEEIARVQEFDPHAQPVIVDGLVHQKGKMPRPATEADYDEAKGTPRRGPPTPRDTPSCGDGSFDARMQRRDEESMHAAQNPLWPWQITKEEYDALKSKHGALADLFYNVRAVGVYQLEHIVGSQFCPKELYPVYTFAGENRWYIKRDKVPAELEDNFPRLRLELNTKEWEGIAQDHQFMYYQDKSDLKWKIHSTFANWGRDAG